MKRLLLFSLLLWPGIALLAQSPDTTLIQLGNPNKIIEEVVTLDGKITTAITGDPVSGASVSIEGFGNAIQTDGFGNFRLFLPPGSYRIVLDHPGHLPITRRMEVYRSGSISLQMSLPTKEMAEILVTAYGQDTKVADVTAGVERMKVRDIEVQPAFMGEVDVIKSLQWLPGVSSVGEGAAGFNVRGGRADQNLILLEGAPLFNPNHLLGFFSAIQSDMVESFTLYKGHVPAYLGGRASSVLDIATRYGNPDSFQVRLGLGVVSARFAAEGPIGNQGGSFLAGGRSAYSNWVLRQAKDPYISRSEAGFQDAYAAARLPISENNILEVFAYGSRDRFQFFNLFGYAYQTGVAGAHYYHLFQDNMSLEVSAHVGRYDSDYFDPEGFDAGRSENGIGYVHSRQMWSWNPGKHQFRAGMEQTLYDQHEGTLSPDGPGSAVLPSATPAERGLEMAFFLSDDWEPAPWISFSAGIRFVEYWQMGPGGIRQYDPSYPRQLSSVIDSLSFGPWERMHRYSGWEPRASARVRLDENTSIKASYNRLQQFIHLISNTTASTPVDLWQIANAYLRPQVADQFSLGLYRNFDAHRWESSVEAFYKDQSQLIEYQDFASLLVNPFLETELVNAEGRAYGVEAMIRKKRGRLTGWLGYTYSRSLVRSTTPFPEEQINAGAWFPANYDQPHQLDFVANFNLLRGSSFGVNLAYRRGRPFTALEASYETQETVIPLFSYRNEYRIPDYLRIDASLTFGSVVPAWNDQLSFSVYNMLGRDNAYSVFYQRPENTFIPKPYQLSVLGAAFPSLTYQVDF